MKLSSVDKQTLEFREKMSKGENKKLSKRTHSMNMMLASRIVGLGNDGIESHASKGLPKSHETPKSSVRTTSEDVHEEEDEKNIPNVEEESEVQHIPAPVVPM